MTAAPKTIVPKWKYEIRAAVRGEVTEHVLGKGETSIEPATLATLYLNAFFNLLPDRTPFARVRVIITDQAGNTIVDRVLDEAALGSPTAYCLERVIAAPATEGGDPSPERAATGATGGEPRRTPLILVVDDQEETRHLLARLVNGDGYQAVAVGDAAEALAFLETTTPSLVITDFDMPGMNGLTLFTQIRKDPRHRDVPVIMFSANDGEVREAALREGVDAYVVKYSMDWATLQREILRLAGAGTLEKSLPDVTPAREKDAG